MVARFKGQKLLTLFQLPDNEAFACYEEYGLYVTYYGPLAGVQSRNVVMEFVGTAKSAAMFDSYLVLFNTDFVEIRNIENGRLRQIIYGEDIRCLDDGNQGANTQGPPRSLKFGMVHPQNDRYYMVLELLLDEGRAEEPDILIERYFDSQPQSKTTETLPVIIREFGRRQSTKEPLDSGPAIMEMLLKDSVDKDFLEESEAYLTTDGEV
jgi:hypothetical protein